ncbi:putative translational regulatory protein ArgL [Pseudocitrobacter faecalis]|uniref:putative translational regulatory protein ArgL n=1 Tax=Pseudocitrobacter faecalis TaxID=1398493 RepID=UPI0035D7E109
MALLLLSHTASIASTFTRKICVPGLQLNIHTYKLNFNSISGLSHARTRCRIFIISTF